MSVPRFSAELRHGRPQNTTKPPGRGNGGRLRLNLYGCTVPLGTDIAAGRRAEMPPTNLHLVVTS